MWLILLLLLTLAGCGTRSTRPAVDLCQNGRNLLRKQQYVSLLAQVEAQLPHVKPGSPCDYHLRLLRAEILLEQRQLEKARQALNFALPSGPQWTEQWARYRLCQANLDRQSQHPDSALKYLNESSTLAAAIHSSDLLAEIDLRTASLAMQKGNLPAAEAGFRHVLDDAVRRGDPYMQMKAKGNIAFLLYDREFRYEEAIPWAVQALDLARGLSAVDDAARNNVNLGWCHYRLSDLDQAQQYFQHAQQGFAQTGNRRDEAQAVQNMASVLLDKYQYPAAAQMYQRALAIAASLKDTHLRASCLNNLADIAIRSGDWNAAERYNNEAAALWGHDGHWQYYSLVKAGRIATGRKDYAHADQSFRAVLQDRIKDPIPVLQAHMGRAYMLAQQANIPAAEAEYRSTDQAMERRRTALSSQQDRVNYFSGQIDFYQEYVDFIMAQHRSGDALRIAESSRARALIDRLRLARPRRIAGTPADFQQFAKLSGSVLLSYWIAPERSYLWAVTASGIQVFPLPGESRISEIVKQYDDLIQAAADPLDTRNAVVPQLYDTLLQPAAALLPKNSKVIIVPDGPLYGLNFETIVVPGAPRHYWIEDVTISITPSLDLLSPGPAPRRPPSPSLLLIGNPVSPLAEQYPDLPYAAREIDDIRRECAAFHPVVRQKADARPEAYSRSAPADFEFIHFVAHAVADSRDPLESAVILSRGSSDYKLRARDVLATPVHATLVTLSACRSAGVRIYAGEGLVGFPWAFLEAGARNVIAGLWDVTDRSTAELMSRLYAGIAHGAAPAAALRDAKLAAIHSANAYKKPYYWGPFELFTR